jgi:hypothetical protein
VGFGGCAVGRPVKQGRQEGRTFERMRVNAFANTISATPERSTSISGANIQKWAQCNEPHGCLAP